MVMTVCRIADSVRLKIGVKVEAASGMRGEVSSIRGRRPTPREVLAEQERRSLERILTAPIIAAQRRTQVSKSDLIALISILIGLTGIVITVLIGLTRK
jgi:hypothetical protein